jgi:GDP-L-fucose synthase
MNQKDTADFFAAHRPDYVFLAAAKVGGIVANNRYRADFIYQNIQIQSNVIHQSYLNGVKKLVFLGSTCIYPKDSPQPMKEDALLTSPLEYTNEPYAIAKIAGIKMCESYNLQYGTNFISVMPTNLYGPNDNFNLETSHVLPAILRKMYLAKCLEDNNWDAIVADFNKRPVNGVSGEASQDNILQILKQHGIENNISGVVTLALWGSGNAMREFLWSEEMADATVFVMENVDFSQIAKPNSSGEIRNTHINIGTGEEITVKDVAFLIKKLLLFKGLIIFDPTKPDGTPRKLTDVTKIHQLGWHHRISIEQGLLKLYNWYLAN